MVLFAANLTGENVPLFRETGHPSRRYFLLGTIHFSTELVYV